MEPKYVSKEEYLGFKKGKELPLRDSNTLKTNKEPKRPIASLAWDFYHAKKRAIGPGSWFYENMTFDDQHLWDIFLDKVVGENQKIDLRKLIIQYINSKK